MADPKMTTVNIPKKLRKQIEAARKKTKLGVAATVETAVEKYLSELNKAEATA